jgi:hypothetical protein
VKDVDRNKLAHGMDQWRSFVNKIMNIQDILEFGEFLGYISGDWLVKTVLHGIKNPITDLNWRGQVLFNRGKMLSDRKLYSMVQWVTTHMEIAKF